MSTNHTKMTAIQIPAGQVFVTEDHVAERQDRSVKTVQADRYNGVGIPYCKIGRLVRYRLADVLEYEERNMCRSNSDTPNKLAHRRNMWGQ